MVFPGRFSTGCQRCRKRKVKCDETRPACRRCIVYGKPCPGYSDTFRFRNTHEAQPSASSAKTGAPSKPGVQLTIIQTEHPGSSQSSASTTSTATESPVSAVTTWRTPSPSISAQLEPSYEHTAVSYFMKRFISPSMYDDFPGYLSFVPDMYNHDKPGLLELATLSVAEMAAYNQFGGQKFLQQSYQNYGRAIQAMKESIASDEKATDDRTLAAVILLSAFADIKGGEVVDGLAHASGIYYLVKRRGPEQLATRKGFELFFVALIRLYAHAVLNNDHTYSQLDGLNELSELVALCNPLMNAMVLVSKVLSLRHAISEEARKAPGGAANEALIKDCFETLDAFHQWDADAASCWRETFGSPSAPVPVGEAAGGGHHFDTKTSGTIILLRSCRLILLMCLSEYLGTVTAQVQAEHQDTSEAWATCIAHLQHDINLTMNDILHCVPYALGDLDVEGNPSTVLYDGAGALTILQSLRLVCYNPNSTPDQVAKAQAALERFSSSMGVRSAVIPVGLEDLLEVSGVRRGSVLRHSPSPSCEA